MPPPNPHYTLLLINHETGDRLKIELVDLPLSSFRALIQKRTVLTATERRGYSVH